MRNAVSATKETDTSMRPTDVARQIWVLRRRRSVLVSAVAVAVVAIAGLTVVATRSPAAAARTDQLLAFGDSIAAGHGLGADDNPDAYPALIGARTGYDVHNYAVSGACVVGRFEAAPFAVDGGTPTECPTSGNVVDQLERAEADHVSPSVITLTVGANDVRFTECFESATGFGSAANQCAGSPEFARRQAALEHNLAGLLTDLEHTFPSAQVVLTQYYNPLPSPVSSGHACRVFYYGAAAHDLVGTAQKYLTGQFDAAAKDYQGSIYDEASRFVGALNHSIDVTATNHHAQSVALDFTGHDLCGAYENYTPWVFAPTASATLTVGARLLTRTAEYTYTFSLTTKDACTCDPSHPGGSIPTKGWSPSSRIGGIEASLRDIHWDSNGTPHPNATGQAVIASLVATVIPARQPT
jgi:lysophospholipase L1-like esterase